MVRSCSLSLSWSVGLGENMGWVVDRRKKMHCEAVGSKFRDRFSSKGSAKITSSARKRKQMVWENDDDD